MRKRAHVVISGRVQGVWFRANTKEKAEQLGLQGWVKNRDDGRVEAVFEGEENAVKEMIKWCHHGPPLAEVDSVNVEWEDVRDEYSGFSILY